MLYIYKCTCHRKRTDKRMETTLLLRGVLGLISLSGGQPKNLDLMISGPGKYHESMKSIPQ